VESRFEETPTTVFVPQFVASDTGLPTAGDRIYFARLDDDTAVYIGAVNDDHSGYNTQRTWDWPHSATHLTIDQRGNVTLHTEDTDTKNTTTITLDDGTVTITNSDGTTITLTDTVDVESSDGTTVNVDGGTVTVNGGSNPVVKDIKTTKDTDGHVTSVSTVTSDSIYVE